MKKFMMFALIAVFSVAVLCAGSAKKAEALTLLLPDINFDSSFGAGNDTFVTQGVHFDSSTNLLGVSAAALAITYDGVTSTALVDGTVDYQILLTSVVDLGGATKATFATDGIAGADLIVTDTTGTLLTGNFLSYNLLGVNGFGFGAGEAVFQVTGGSLMPAYNGLKGGIVHLDFSLSTNFSATMFDSDFSGKVKGDIAPVPEPGTIALLGIGLAGLVGVGVRRRAKKNAA